MVFSALPGASENLAIMRNVFQTEDWDPRSQASALCQATYPVSKKNHQAYSLGGLSGPPTLNKALAYLFIHPTKFY